MTKPPLLEHGKGLRLVFRGESYWLDLDVRTQEVTIDHQHHGLMGQPGEVERVGVGRWVEDRIGDRRGGVECEVFDAAEATLRAHLEEGRRAN